METGNYRTEMLTNMETDWSKKTTYNELRKRCSIVCVLNEYRFVLIQGLQNG